VPFVHGQHFGRSEPLRADVDLVGVQAAGGSAVGERPQRQAFACARPAADATRQLPAPDGEPARRTDNVLRLGRLGG
jgi:hypothetical protein